jgi:hypothetical protein
MRRYLVLCITLWFFILAFPSLSPGDDELTNSQGEGKQTEDKTLRLAIGLRSIYYNLTQPTRTIVGNLAALDEEQNYLPVNPVIQFPVSKYLALEFGINQFEDMTLNTDYLRWASDGDLAWTSFMLGLQFRWPHFHKSFVPYIVGGGSYNRNTFLRHNWYYYGFPDPQTYNNWTSQGNKPEDWPNNGYRRIHMVEDSYGVFLGLGADYFLTKNWAINIDWRYHWSQANWTYWLINNDGELRRTPGTVVLDSWVLGLGIKYYF